MIGFHFQCCCVGGNFDWYQWDTAGQSGQSYLAMHTAVQPSASTLDWIDYTSWLADVDNPAWKIDTGSVWGQTTITPLYFTLCAYDNTFEHVFADYHWLDSATSKVVVGLYNATSETAVWEHIISDLTADVWPTAPAGYSSSNYNQVVNSGMRWGNLTSSAGFTVGPLQEMNPVTAHTTDFDYGDSPASLKGVSQWITAVIVPDNPKYRGHSTFGQVQCHTQVTGITGGDDVIAHYNTTNDLVLGNNGATGQTPPFYHSTDSIPHDTLLEWNAAGQRTEKVGSLMVQAWVEFEYPGWVEAQAVDDDLAQFDDCTEASNFATAANNTKAISRLAGVPPRCYPFVFGIRYPKTYLIPSQVPCGPLESPGYTSESVTEVFSINFGPMVAGDEDNPMRVDADDAEADTIYYEEDTTNRLMYSEVNPGFVLVMHVEPLVLGGRLLSADANEDKQWGAIFCHSRRTISVDTGVPREEITDETVRLKIRIDTNLTSIEDKQCWRADELNRYWDMIAAPQIESAQNLPGRHFYYLEQLYTAEPSVSLAGTKGKVQLNRVKVGESSPVQVWQTSVTVNASAAARAPHIRHCSDRYFYLLDFQQVWPADKGGDDGIYYYWVCSHEVEEIGTSGIFQPVIFYPWQDPITRPAHIAPEDHWWQAGTWDGWAGAPHIDSVKYSDNNRIAPLLEVRVS